MIKAWRDYLDRLEQCQTWKQLALKAEQDYQSLLFASPRHAQIEREASKRYARQYNTLRAWWMKPLSEEAPK